MLRAYIPAECVSVVSSPELMFTGTKCVNTIKVGWVTQAALQDWRTAGWRPEHNADPSRLRVLFRFSRDAGRTLNDPYCCRFSADAKLYTPILGCIIKLAICYGWHEQAQAQAQETPSRHYSGRIELVVP